MAGILDVVRARRDELNISHETIDEIAGFPAGYTSKLLAPTPMRGISHMSLGGILGALAIGLVVVEDPGQRAKVEGRWRPRKRLVRRELPSALLANGSEGIVVSTSGDEDVQQTTFVFPAQA